MSIRLLLAGGIALSMGVSAAPPQTRSASQPEGARVLHFPSDRVVGYLVMHEHDPRQEIRFDEGGRLLDSDRWTAADARGDVTVPVGRVVSLNIPPQGWRNLAWLAKLSPDDLQMVRFEHDRPGVPLAGDRVMPGIALMTGLKCLDHRRRPGRSCGDPNLERVAHQQQEAVQR